MSIQKPDFFFVDAVTGAGKTRAAVDFAISLPAMNFCFVMPSKKLIDSTTADLKERHPSAKHRVNVIFGDPSKEPVTKRIMEHIKQVRPEQGNILFITHEAFIRLPYWHLPENWHIVVDEVLQVTYGEAFTLSENRSKLIELLSLAPHDETYSIVEAADHTGIRAVASSGSRDQMTALLQSLGNKLLDTSHWWLFVDTKQFERFTAGQIRQIELHGLLHPSIFTGFASVTLMAANLRESMMYRHFVNAGCCFTEHKRITSKLRYADHTNGSRLTIMYFSDRNWSKALRDHLVEVDGKRRTLGDIYLDEIRQRFKGQPYLWLGNNDVGDVLSGVRLPNVPHGLNEYQGYHRCAIVSALNPTRGHGGFLQTVARIDERHVRRAILSQVAYQALGRGSLRNPAADEPFVLIVPDRSTADDVAEMYPGCKIEQMESAVHVPAPAKAGRKAVHDSDAARKAAAKRRKAWKDEQIGLATKYPLIGNFVSSDQPGFIFSLWRKYNTRNWENQRHLSTSEFFAILRRRSAEHEYAEKADNYLGSPALFREVGKGHTLENVECVKGVAIDLDGTDMTPEDVANILPEIEMMIVSSWSHCAEESCFRLWIPTSTAMSSDASKAIRMMIVDRFRKAGFHDKDAPGKKHGTDMGKLHSAALFFLPCKRPDGFLCEYSGESRKPIGPAEWIKKCPPEIVDRVIGGSAPEGEVVELLPVDGYTDWQQAGFDRAKQIWRSHRPGEGNDQFNRLGWRLHGYKMALSDIEATLRAEAHWSRSPGDRLIQIPYIVNAIRQKG